MKRNILFVVFIIAMGIVDGCVKDKLPAGYDAKLRVDSVKQDSVLFAGNIYIKGKVRVFYTVLNNDKVVLNTYRYTISVMNADSTLFQIVESHHRTVPPNSQLHDSTKIGIGNSKEAWASLSNILFQ